MYRALHAHYGSPLNWCGFRLDLDEETVRSRVYASRAHMGRDRGRNPTLPNFTNAKWLLLNIDRYTETRALEELPTL